MSVWKKNFTLVERRRTEKYNCILLCRILAQSHNCMPVTMSLADVAKIVFGSMRWTKFLYRIFTLKIKLKHRHIMAHGAVAGGQMWIICYKKTAEGGWDVCAPYKHLSHLTLHQVRSILSGHPTNPMKLLCEYTFGIFPSWKNFHTNAPRHPKHNSRGLLRF